MPVIRRFRWVFTIAIVAICAVTVVAGAAVTDLNPRVAAMASPSAPTVSPAGPLVILTDLEPGDVRSASFTVGNPNGSTTLARIAGRLTSGSPSLYTNLVAELSTNGDGVFWRGTLGQLAGSSAALTPIFAGQDKPMTLTVSVPPDLDNGFQALTSRFALDFSLDDMSVAATERTPPTSRLSSIKPGKQRLKQNQSIRKLRRKRVKIYGRAIDAESGVARVEVSLMKIGNRGRRERLCRSWNPAKNRYQLIGRRAGSCRRMVWFNAIGAERFRFVLKPKMVRRGRYILRVRAIDKANNIEIAISPRKKNVLRYRIR